MASDRPDERTVPHVRSDPVYVVKAQLFRVLGHPIRIRILELLGEGERTVGDLAAPARARLRAPRNTSPRHASRA